MENYATTESVVLSITDVNQISTAVKNASSTDKRPTSGGIVRSIAGIHKLFENVMRNSESVQKVYSDVADLAVKIRIQRIAFDNSCKMLLVTAAKSRQDVDNMIENRRHPIWRDTMAHQNFDTMMARFYHLCLAALEHFQESLSEISIGLHALRGHKTKKATTRYQFLLGRWNPPSLGTTEDFPQLLQNLRSYNDIFCTLIWQAISHRSGRQFGSSFGGNLDCPSPIRAARASHHHFGCIQRASQVLYETLCNVWTCRDYEAHSLNISLNFDHAKAGATVWGEDLRFNIAVTSPHLESPYCLVIYTAHSEFCMYQAGEVDRSPNQIYHRKRVAGPAAQSKSADLFELDAHRAAHRAEAGDQKAAGVICPESLRNRVRNLGLEEDLCYCLRSSSIAIEPKQGTEYSCIGYLETKFGRRSRFFNVHRDEHQKRDSHSLDDVLVRASNERRAIPLENRLRIALFLAAGVLHLSSSAWLRQAWSSKDIQFFDMDDDERCTLGEPFLQTKLENNTACGPAYETKSPAATRSCLLSLGLVLIELAFTAPWRKLQLKENLTEDLREWEKNLLNLMLLSDTVSRELGSRYAKVVQTCLFQGIGTEETHGLEKAELDGLIYEDVVRELDRCLSAVTFPGR